MAENRCVGCETPGEIGAPCMGKVCRLHGYHFMPGDIYARARAALGARKAPLIGSRIGRYLIVDLIGGGGFATVYLALQLPLRMRCALKVMQLPLDDCDGEVNWYDKFRVEADALAIQNHPNVVRLIEYGNHRGQPYLVMEYVDAPGLDTIIQARRKAGTGWSPDEVRHVIGQLLYGLEAAHRAGIVHRDIKPANILVQDVPGNPSLVRIVDFGLAKFFELSPLTRVIAGTPQYMAPELSRKEAVTPAADLYSVAVIVAEMILGRLPSRRAPVDPATANFSSDTSLKTRLVDCDALPPLLRGFLEKGLASDPRLRCPSAESFRTELSAALAHHVPASTAPAGADLLAMTSMRTEPRYGGSAEGSPGPLPTTPLRPTAAIPDGAGCPGMTSGIRGLALGVLAASVLAAGIWWGAAPTGTDAQESRGGVPLLAESKAARTGAHGTHPFGSDDQNHRADVITDDTGNTNQSTEPDVASHEADVPVEEPASTHRSLVAVALEAEEVPAQASLEAKPGSLSPPEQATASAPEKGDGQLSRGSTMGGAAKAEEAVARVRKRSTGRKRAKGDRARELEDEGRGASVSTIAVHSQPRGVSVSLSGKELGRTPLDITVRPGESRRYTFTKVWYENQERTLSAGDPEVVITMKPAMW